MWASAVFRLNASMQRQTEERTPRHPEEFAAGISDRQGSTSELGTIGQTIR